MKLISMVDYVLREEDEKLSTAEEKYDSILNYADFLKQPLKLEMFIPCGEEGEVLKEEKKECIDDFVDNEIAKEKVLFKGFELDIIGNRGVFFKWEGLTFRECNKTKNIYFDKIMYKDIESFIHWGIELTDNAIKQL